MVAPADPHPLVARLMRRLGLAASQGLDAAGLAALLASVSALLADVDRERCLLQRSQDTASQEMATLNQALQASQAGLASLLSLSSDWVWEQNRHGRFSQLSEALAQRTGTSTTWRLKSPPSMAGPATSASAASRCLMARPSRAGVVWAAT